jgi:MtfA peptidase
MLRGANITIENDHYPLLIRKFGNPVKNVGVHPNGIIDGKIKTGDKHNKMPQDTTIYWDGYGPLPAEIDSLPPEQQQQVLAIINKKRDELSYSDPSGTYLFLLVFIVLFSIAAIYSNYKTRKSATEDIATDPDDLLPKPAAPHVLVYHGHSLNFNDELLAAVLVKRSVFFNALNEADKAIFIQRLKKMMAIKTFIIHDVSGFKEMPILICATAIQISFGLNTYLLPYFSSFNIYPGAFLRTQPFLRFLIGNVSGNSINLSWEHFLQGFELPSDGQNVGMHELAHALYYQTFVVEENVDQDFRDTFAHFNDHGNKVYEAEKRNTPRLYSDYAMRDFQEFWAESIEIFFEKPVQLKKRYPDLYVAMSNLLNQDPATAALQHLA